MKSKGLFDDKKRTIHEISAEEGVSPSRVSQILQKVNKMIEEKIARGEISRDGFIKILY
jgi:DNA-directed RNA polymerase specialized sigma subunit